MKWDDILTEIKRLIKEPETDGHWTDADLLRKANLVQTDIARKLECFINTETLTVDTETWEYEKPDKCWQIQEITYDGKRITGTNSDQLDKDYEGRSTIWRDLEGTPTKYYIADMDNIVLFPNPKNESAVVKIKYITGPEDLVDGDSIPFDNKKSFQDAHQIIIDGVVFRCLLEDQNELFKEFKNLYTEGILLLKRQLKNVDEEDTFNG